MWAWFVCTAYHELFAHTVMYYCIHCLTYITYINIYVQYSTCKCVYHALFVYTVYHALFIYTASTLLLPSLFILYTFRMMFCIYITHERWVHVSEYQQHMLHPTCLNQLSHAMHMKHNSPKNGINIAMSVSVMRTKAHHLSTHPTFLYQNVETEEVVAT